MQACSLGTINGKKERNFLYIKSCRGSRSGAALGRSWEADWLSPMQCRECVARAWGTGKHRWTRSNECWNAWWPRAKEVFKLRKVQLGGYDNFMQKVGLYGTRNHRPQTQLSIYHLEDLGNMNSRSEVGTGRFHVNELTQIGCCLFPTTNWVCGHHF